MTKEEFETLTEQTISPEDYKIVEFVYMYHPNVSDVGGKQFIAEVYKVGGIELIKDMRNAAQINYEFEEAVAELQSRIRGLNNRIERLRQDAEERLANR